MEVWPFLVAVLVIGSLLFLVLFVTKNTQKPLDKTRYQSNWLRIESGLRKAESATFSMTILEADKLVDRALKDRGVKGDTMGERMKHASTVWSNANNVWNAHKIRNRIAHETDVQISYGDVTRSLQYYRQALKDLGAL